MVIYIGSGREMYSPFLFTHVSHFPQTIDKEIEGKCIIIYISVL